MAGKMRDLDIDHLIPRYEAGESARKLGKEIGVKGETLARHLAKRGVKLRTPSDVQRLKSAHLLPPIAELVALYESGESVKALSGRFGLTRPRVADELRRAGISVRGRSAAERVKWARIKAQGRAAVERQCGNAWEAVRGVPISPEHAAKIAEGHMRSLSRIGAWETEIADALRARGVSVTQQQACGRRNIDLALNEHRIAVEIQGTWKSAAEREAYRQRCKDLIDGGWSVAWVDCVDGCTPAKVAEHLIAVAQFLGSNPAARGGYWVIDGQAQPFARACLQFDDIPVVPRPDARDESP